MTVTAGDRDRMRAEYDWMSNGTFSAFWTSYRILRELQDSGAVTPEQAEGIMTLVIRANGKRPNVTEFRRQVYELTDYERPMELTRHITRDDEPGDPRQLRQPRRQRPPDLQRSKIRDEYSWMSDGTFSAFWKSLQALHRLVRSGMISCDQAEQVRLNVPKMPSGRPNIHEFRRRVRIIEEKVEQKYGQVNPEPLPPVTGPVINGRMLQAVSRQGRRVRLEWVETPLHAGSHTTFRLGSFRDISSGMVRRSSYLSLF